VNGLLVVDKPGGMTSHDVVGRLRRITGEKSIGHLGTLDPLATGVLPLLLGKYTRLAQYFSSAEKSYTGAIRFGFSTDTYDAEGVAAGPDKWPDFEPSLTLETVRASAARFQGEMQQMPPPYSAKKIAGTPAYKLAREGKPVELKTAVIRITSFAITALDGAEAAFEITVSAGGYVRSVAQELGQDLGCGAHLSRLRRTQAGIFTLSEAHSLEELDALAGNAEALEELCLHPRSLLPEMPSVTGDEMSLGRLRNGAQANLPEFSGAPLVKVFAGQRELVGIAKRVAGTLFQPVVVLG
jgi:tRNA pseudouridine55 synthase